VSGQKWYPRRGPRVPIRLSMEDPEPMYRQIESQMRDFILSGELRPGTKLPTIRALAEDLSCSVITTRRAYQDLEVEGLILTRQGRGTVVAQIPVENMRARRREAVEAAFTEAVRTGRRAGLTEGEIRDFLDEALQRNHTNVQGDVS
jgi:GntR family transcriptional regulator